MDRIEELKQRLGEIRTRLTELHSEGESRFTDEQRSEWNTLNEEREEKEATLRELEARAKLVADLGGSGEHTRSPGADFQVQPQATRGEDIFDLSTVRASIGAPEEATREMTDRAKRANEMAHFAHPEVRSDDARERIEMLLERHSEQNDGEFARQMLVTGSPTYRRAFGKQLIGKPLSNEEQRALSLGGGVKQAVPFTLDPTVLATSNGSVNPLRLISRVETITGSEWKGVTSDGVTATYGTEASGVADNAPTLSQPEASVDTARSFVPYSIESEDWTALEREMAIMFADARDELEAEKFYSGTGNDEPQGFIVGATEVVETAENDTLAIPDLFTVEDALGARFQPNAQWVAANAQYNRLREAALALEGGSTDTGIFGRIQDGLPKNKQGNTGQTLIGYPMNKLSTAEAEAADGDLVFTLGDFSRYFLILDRLGMTVELVPHIMGANRFPTGQRGLYAYWRNTSRVLSAKAFQTLKIK